MRTRCCVGIFAIVVSPGVVLFSAKVTRQVSRKTKVRFNIRLCAAATAHTRKHIYGSRPLTISTPNDSIVLGGVSGTNVLCDPKSPIPTYMDLVNSIRNPEVKGEANTELPEYSTLEDIQPSPAEIFSTPDEGSRSLCSNRRTVLAIVGICIIAAIAAVAISLPLTLKETTTTPNVTVQIEGITNGYVDENLSLLCTVRNSHSVSHIDFLYNQTVLASFKASDRTVTDKPPRFLLVAHQVHDGYEVVLTLSNVTCQDAGRYTCLARDARGDVGKWTRLSVMKPPVPPTLEVPLLIDGLPHEPPVCRVSSIGHNPFSSISWWVKDADNSSEVQLDPIQQQDTMCYNGAACAGEGVSILNAQTDMGWNHRQLCCRIQDPLQTELVAMETCQTLTVLPPLDMKDNDLAVIGKAANVTCFIRYINVTEVTFLLENEILATFDKIGSTVTSNRTDMTLFIDESDSKEWQAILSIKSVTCSHRGKYTCRIVRSNGTYNHDSTTLQVRRQPETPRLTIPPTAETVTAQDPLCIADTLGYNPAMRFKWIRIRQDRTNETFDEWRYTQKDREDDSACNTTGESIFDGQRYGDGFWNNSQLCCQLTDPGTGKVASEVCGKVQTIPADFCSEGTVELRCYPYEPCNTYVHCNLLTKVVYFNYCNNDVCFDPPTQTCTRLFTRNATC